MSIAKDDRMWDDKDEKQMLDAFRQAFRRLLNREVSALERGGDRNLTKRWDNTADKWHRRLLHAKTRSLLSVAVHELVAEAARSPDRNSRSGGPAFLLPKISEDETPEAWHARNDSFHAAFRRKVNHPGEWKKVRDIALLALATFTDKRLSQSNQENDR